MSNHRPTSASVEQKVLAVLRANADQTARLDQLAATQFGLNRTDSRGLELLRRLGPMPATTLARHLGLTTGGVTTVIDRLEQAGYARRRSGGADRRRILVEATEQAAAREQEIFGALIAETAAVVVAVPAADLTVILDFLERLGSVVALHADRLEAGQAHQHE
jgi:DNA-binding MarR family transcriptional regulator